MHPFSFSLPPCRACILRCTRGGHSSVTPVARRLVQPTRMIWPQNRLGPKPRVIPIWSCSRWGLPCRPCCQVRGALLPHPFTLTPASRSGLLSVALSLRSPSPGVIRHRVSMEPGLSSSSRLPHCQRPPGQLAGAVVRESGKCVKPTIGDRPMRPALSDGQAPKAEGSPDVCPETHRSAVRPSNWPVVNWLSCQSWATENRSTSRKATRP